MCTVRERPCEHLTWFCTRACDRGMGGARVHSTTFHTHYTAPIILGIRIFVISPDALLKPDHLIRELANNILQKLVKNTYGQTGHQGGRWHKASTIKRFDCQKLESCKRTLFEILTVSIQTLKHSKSGDTKKSAFLKH